MIQIVDKTIMEADKDRDGKISFEEFTKMVENTDVSLSMTLGKFWSWNTKQSWYPPLVHDILTVRSRCGRLHCLLWKPGGGLLLHILFSFPVPTAK